MFSSRDLHLDQYVKVCGEPNNRELKRIRLEGFVVCVLHLCCKQRLLLFQHMYHHRMGFHTVTLMYNVWVRPTCGFNHDKYPSSTYLIVVCCQLLFIFLFKLYKSFQAFGLNQKILTKTDKSWNLSKQRKSDMWVTVRVMNE